MNFRTMLAPLCYVYPIIKTLIADADFQLLSVKSTCTISNILFLHMELKKKLAYYYSKKNLGNARPGESALHPITPKTPSPQFQTIEIKKRKGKQ